MNYSRGMPENPMSQEDIERKFMSLATAAIGLERAANILTLEKMCLMQSTLIHKMQC